MTTSNRADPQPRMQTSPRVGWEEVQTEPSARRAPSRRVLGLLAPLLLLPVAGCATTAPSPPPTAAPTVPAAPPSPSSSSSSSSSIEVDLTFEAVVNPDGSVTIQAASNLPDGTELLGSVAQKPTGTPKRYNGYQGGQTQTLVGGTAVFGPYSKQGGELPKGKYDVTVTMPIAVNQPEAVKAVIGLHGENLTGSQVEHEYGSAFVMVEHTLTID